MMYATLGLITAILAWGSYMVPLKKHANLSPLRFQAWMSLGIGVSSLLVGVLRGYPNFTFWGIGSGLLWSVGALLSFYAIRVEGLAGASSRWMGTGILTSFLSGVVILQEKVNLPIALAGVLLLVVGLVGITRAGASQQTSNAPKGFFPYWRSVLSGLIFGNYLLPLPFSGVDSFDYIAPMGLGILLGGLGIAAFTSSKEVAPRMVSVGSGLAWNLANVGSLLAVEGFGFAVGFPLTQLALLVSLAWSVGVFGEYADTKSRIRLLSGAVILLFGAALLGLARKF